MKEKYQQIKAKFNELEDELQDPEVVNDSDLLQKKSKVYSDLKPINNKIKQLEQIKVDIEETKEMLESDIDQDMYNMAKQELEGLKDKKRKLDEQLKKLTRPKDPQDSKNVIVEIRAGAGGDEAALFARDLARMYMRYAENKDWEVSIITKNQNDLGGYKEAVFKIEGRNVYHDLKYEMGVHRVQRVPETEKSGRIHTSTASVAVLPEAEETEIDIADEDITIETFSASKPGGQSVNTSQSAIRIKHHPTNIQVQCQDEKSQKQNKKKAMEVLRARVYKKKQEEKRKKREEARRSQIGSGGRSEKIRTYNYPQDRITDHRIETNYSNIEAMLDAEGLDEIIEDLREARYEQLDDQEFDIDQFVST
jgi:peptide chain release factor 1